MLRRGVITALLGLGLALLASGVWAEPAPDTVAVAAKDNLFDAQTITVPVGTTVTWTNTGAAPHTVTADDKSFDSGLLNSGGTFSMTFNTPGTIGYYCAFHGAPGSGMFGKIVVTPAAAAPAPVAASAKDNVFDPQTITIPAGTTVTWTNSGAVPHTVTADDKKFDSGLLNPGQSFSQTFDTPGTYGFYCTLHGAPGTGMFGTIVVTPAAAATPVPASSGAASGPSAAASARDNVFDPPILTVSAGTTVTWTNSGAVPHTVTADDKKFDSGLLNPGQSFSQKFDTPGSYRYFCELHGGPGTGMFGTVVVTP